MGVLPFRLRWMACVGRGVLEGEPGFVLQSENTCFIRFVRNGNVSPYSFLELLSISTSGRVLNGLKNKYTSAPAVMPDGLTWETATTTDVGLDFGMLNNRLQFNGDYYIRKTTDMYTVGETLPDVFGASSPKGNYADMTTKGWEITLTWRDQFTLAEKPFNYEIRGTLSDYISTIDRYNNQTGNLDDYYAGKRVGEIWGYVTEGLFKDQADIDSHADQTLIQSSSKRITYPGDVKIKDLNGDHVIDYGNNTVDDHGDKTVIGNALPRYAYSINLSGDWNNFFLSAFFQGVGKQDWYPSSECISGDSITARITTCLPGIRAIIGQKTIRMLICPVMPAIMLP